MAKKKKAGEAQVKVTDGGSLKKVGKEAEKSAGKFDTFGKSAHSADRAGRGVAQMSSNSTKNFSKLSQGITGGLVPAYATLAAQLFALDALFRFLKDSADFRVLKEGQMAFAAATGTAYKSLAREIQAATDAQVTFAESSQAAAIGMAAGLSPEQMLKLSEAAKTVSIALGRDTTDSFNRLVRGVTKAEPELLDELGIVLRLEEASIRYAAALGLNKNELTVFQKSQAVTNEVLRQAEEKFGAMNDIQETTTNQIAKMAIAFDEVLNNIKGIIGPISEFFGTAIAKNVQLATMAIGVFAATMLKKLVPAFKTVDAAALGKGISARMQDPQSGGAGMFTEGKTAESKARYARLQEGTMTKKDIKRYQDSLKVKQSSFVNYNNATKAMQKKTYYELEAMQRAHIANEKTGFKRSWHNWKASLNLMKAEYGTFVGTIKGYSQALGTALNTALGIIGWIGIALMAAQMAWDKWGHLIKETNPHLEEFSRRTEESTAKLKSLNTEMKNIADVSEKGIIKDWEKNMVRTGNALNSMNVQGQLDDFNDLSALRHYDREAWTQYQKEFEQFLLNMTAIQPALQKYMEAYYEGRFTVDMQEQMNKEVQGFIAAGQAQQNYARGTSKLVKEQNKLVQALPKVKYQDYIGTLEEMIKSQTIMFNSKLAEQEAMKHDKQIYDEIGTQLEELTARTFAHRAELELMNTVQREDVRLKEEAIALQQTSAFKKFKGTYAQDAMLQIEKQRQVVARKLMEYEAARMVLQVQVEAASGRQKKALQDQLKLQRQTLDLEMTRLNAIIMQNDAVFKTYNALFVGFQKDFASAVGAALRGDDSGFDKLRENLRKTITDALGQSITNKLMENFLGGILPRSLAQKMGDVHTAGALEIGKAINTGAKSFVEEWETGGKIKFTLDTFITQLSMAMGTYKKGRVLELKARNQRLRQEQANRKTAWEDSPGPRYEEDEGGNLVETKKYTKWANRMKQDPIKLISDSLQGEAKAGFLKEAGAAPIALELGNALRESIGLAVADVRANTRQNQTGPTWRNRDHAPMIQKLIQNDERFARFFDDVLADGQVSTEELQKVLEQIDVAAGTAKYGTFKQKIYESDKVTSILDAEKTGEKSRTVTDAVYGVMAKIADPEAIQEALNRLHGSDEKQQKIKNAYTMGESQTKALIESNEKLIKALGLNEEEMGELEDILKGMSPEEIDKYIGGKSKTDLLTDPDDPKVTKIEKFADNKWVQGTQDFLGGASMILGAAGQGEKSAKLMKIAATIMMTVAIMDRARVAIESGGSFWNKVGAFFTGGGARYGGVMGAPGYRSFQGGGVSQGPTSGYGAILHGTEAVVPLGNDRSIPVKMQGGGNINNTSVTVNMESGAVDTKSDAENGRALGHLIQASVLDTISREQRSGGLLDVGG